MSTAPAAPARRSFVSRLRTPIVVLALYAAVVSGVWLWPDQDFPNVYRSMTTWLSTFVTSLVVAVWWLGFSGTSWIVRLGLPVALIGLFFGTTRRDFTGDVMPRVQLIWVPVLTDKFPFIALVYRPTADEARAAARQRDAEQAPPAEGSVAEAGPGDWPRFFGPGNDGAAQPMTLPADFAAVQPLWKRECGLGFSSFAVVGKAVYTLEQVGEEEALVRYDADTGRPVWEHKWPSKFVETFGNGPRSTPTVVDGLVYAVGARGHFTCVDATTGQPKWSRELLGNEPDTHNLIWGMSGSPLIVDDLVIVTPGYQTKAESNPPAGKGVRAYDRKSGELRWEAGERQAGYSSAVLGTVAGVRQVLVYDALGLTSYDPAGKGELWFFPWTNAQKITVANPHVLDGDRILLPCGYGTGCVLLKLTREGEKLTPSVVWESKKLQPRFTNVVVRGGNIYGLDEGILACVDAETGKRKWKEGRYGQGQVILAGDVLVVQVETGEVAFVAAEPEKFRLLGTLPALSRKGWSENVKAWNVPAVADGRLYVRSDKEMMAFELGKK